MKKNNKCICYPPIKITLKKQLVKLHIWWFSAYDSILSEDHLRATHFSTEFSFITNDNQWDNFKINISLISLKIIILENSCMLWDIGVQGIIVLAFSIGDPFSSCSVVFLVLLIEYLKQNLWCESVFWYGMPLLGCKARFETVRDIFNQCWLPIVPNIQRLKLNT